MNPEKKWFERPMRIAALQCNFENGENLAVIDKWLDMGFNTEQLFHPIGDDYSALYDPEKHRQILSDYITASHAKNLRIILYLNVHILGPTLAHHAPEWAQQNADGSIIKMYDTYPAVCINSPWQDYFFEVLTALTEFDIDGIFLDGPAINKNGCHCPHCQERFQKWMQRPYPDTESSFEFNSRTKDTFLNKAYQFWKSRKPESLMYMNLPVMHATPGFVNVREALNYNDIIGTEGGFMFYMAPKKAFLWRPSIAAKLLEAIAQDRPRVIFMAGDQKPWSWYPHSPAETTLCTASCAANGAHIWWGIHGSTRMLDSATGDAARNFFQWHTRNEQYFEDTTPLASVGVLFPYASEKLGYSTYQETDFTGEVGQKTEIHGNLMESLNGCVAMLTRSQIPFRLLTDLEPEIPELDNVDCLILPAASALHAKTVARLQEFVHNGGTLISSFDSSLFDGKGKQRDNFQLADIFGADYNGHYFTRANHDYVKPLSEEHELFADLRIPLLPAPLQGIAVKARSNATVLADFLAAMPGRYVPLTEPATPFIIENTYGKGKSYLLAGSFFQMYADYAPPEYRKLCAKIIQRHSQPVVEFDKNCGALEVVVRQQNQRWLIHFINYNGDMTRPIEQIFPLTDITIKVNTTEKFSQATRLVSTDKIKMTPIPGGYELVISKINIHELIVLD